MQRFNTISTAGNDSNCLINSFVLHMVGQIRNIPLEQELPEKEQLFLNQLLTGVSIYYEYDIDPHIFRNWLQSADTCSAQLYLGDGLRQTLGLIREAAVTPFSMNTYDNGELILSEDGYTPEPYPEQTQEYAVEHIPAICKALGIGCVEVVEDIASSTDREGAASGIKHTLVTPTRIYENVTAVEGLPPEAQILLEYGAFNHSAQAEDGQAALAELERQLAVASQAQKEELKMLIAVTRESLASSGQAGRDVSGHFSLLRPEDAWQHGVVAASESELFQGFKAAKDDHGNAHAFLRDYFGSSLAEQAAQPERAAQEAQRETPFIATVFEYLLGTKPRPSDSLAANHGGDERAPIAGGGRRAKAGEPTVADGGDDAAPSPPKTYKGRR